MIKVWFTTGAGSGMRNRNCQGGVGRAPRTLNRQAGLQ